MPSDARGRSGPNALSEVSPASNESAAPPGASLRDSVNAEGRRLAVRRVMYATLWIWPVFTLVDIYMAVFFHPSTPAWHFLSMRAVEQGALFAVYRMTFLQSVSPRLLAVAYNVAFWGAAVFISLMAIDFGGLESPYMHGLSLAMLIRAVTAGMPWRLALVDLAPIALIFPFTLGGAAVFSAPMRAAWLDAHTVLTFVSQYIFVLGSVFIGASSSHVVWAAQQQVYQARKLGKYRLEVPIGKGGMSQVWLARDERLRRKVALKLLRSGAAPDTTAIRRFEREARAASMLSDPHTIRIFDFGASDDGIYYIAMEYLSGADLAVLVRSHGPMPFARAARLMAQACTSLAEAHAAGIIHRDIKPQNLFVTRVGQDYDFLKVLDFGIARVISAEKEDPGLTRTGVIHGTPAFMAPEVCRGDRADERSDIYALGATMYFLLTGSPPFDGDTAGHLMAAHILQAPQPLATRRGAPVPEELEGLVLRCLAKDPRDRVPSARELGEALAAMTDSAAWTAEDAERFWQVERVAKLGKWDAPTESTEREPA